MIDIKIVIVIIVTELRLRILKNVFLFPIKYCWVFFLNHDLLNLSKSRRDLYSRWGKDFYILKGKRTRICEKGQGVTDHGSLYTGKLLTDLTVQNGLPVGMSSMSLKMFRHKLQSHLVSLSWK